MNTEEEDEDQRNVNIPETKGYREVQRPLLEYHDITVQVKTK